MHPAGSAGLTGSPGGESTGGGEPAMMMTIHIKNLRLRTIVGVNDWERRNRQEVVVNVQMEFDGAKAVGDDNVDQTVDYKAVKRRIMEAVESSSFFLLEKLAARILQIVMEDPRVLKVAVEVDKPLALRFADSVSVSCSAERAR
jgi:FolB domain-containing protein